MNEKTLEKIEKNTGNTARDTQGIGQSIAAHQVSVVENTATIDRMIQPLIDLAKAQQDLVKVQSETRLDTNVIFTDGVNKLNKTLEGIEKNTKEITKMVPIVSWVKVLTVLLGLLAVAPTIKMFLP